MQRLLKRTTHQINEQETRWTGFLAETSEENAPWFLRETVDTTKHHGRSIVREAWSKCQTIVTSNGSDFLHYFQEFQNPPSEHECRDLWGLIDIPKDLHDSRKHLEAISNGLPILPNERLHWPAVGFLNLYIRLENEGELEIRRFPRCPFCEHSIGINNSWHTWYSSLPLV